MAKYWPVNCLARNWFNFFLSGKSMCRCMCKYDITSSCLSHDNWVIHCQRLVLYLAEVSFCPSTHCTVGGSNGHMMWNVSHISAEQENVFLRFPEMDWEIWRRTGVTERETPHQMLEMFPKSTFCFTQSFFLKSSFSSCYMRWDSEPHETSRVTVGHIA